MLSEDQIKNALHASRVVPLDVANPHGPIGLEALAEAVSQILPSMGGTRIERPISVPFETWQKLDEVARRASATGPRTLSASDIAAAILEKAVAGT